LKHTIEDIVDNQKKFKDNIYDWFVNNYESMYKSLKAIDSDDEFVIKQKEKLSKKMKKSFFLDRANRFFLLCDNEINKNRNRKFYIFWDETNEEAEFYRYK